VTTDTVVKRREARRYLAFILDTKRKKDGKAPPWLYELASHAEQGTVQGCHDVASKIYLPPEALSMGQRQDSSAQEQSTQNAQTKTDKKSKNK
jgi:hypothetical protein